MRHVLVAIACGALLGGCVDDLPTGPFIADNRVIGAISRVVGAPERATPLPGETLEIEWLVVDARERLPLEWAFVACIPLPTLSGNPRCAGDTFAPVAGTTSPPRFTFTVPDEATLGDAKDVLVIGAICAAGTLSFDDAAMTASCAGEGAKLTNVTFQARITRALPGNLNPVLTDNRFFLGETAWDAPASIDALPLEACAATPASSTMPHVQKDAPQQVLRFTADGADRERYTLASTVPPTALREVFQVSHFVDAGELERLFSVVEDDDEREEVVIDLAYNLPPSASVPPGGMLARFHFVARDQRGGVAFTSRALCVVP